MAYIKKNTLSVLITTLKINLILCFMFCYLMLYSFTTAIVSLHITRISGVCRYIKKRIVFSLISKNTIFGVEFRFFFSLTL